MQRIFNWVLCGPLLFSQRFFFLSVPALVAVPCSLLFYFEYVFHIDLATRKTNNSNATVAAVKQVINDDDALRCAWHVIVGNPSVFSGFRLPLPPPACSASGRLAGTLVFCPAYWGTLETGIIVVLLSSYARLIEFFDLPGGERGRRTGVLYQIVKSHVVTRMSSFIHIRRQARFTERPTVGFLSHCTKKHPVLRIRQDVPRVQICIPML